MSKSMKFANGKGSVTKLKGNRRKPYLVRASASYNISADGKLKEDRKIIGYASTKEEAYKMLVDYLNVPYDLTKSKYTFEQIYEEWSNSHFKGISKSTQNLYTTAYNHCSLLYKRTFKDLRLADYYNVLDNEKNDKGEYITIGTIKTIKILLGLLNQYAMKNDIIMKDYSEFIDIKKYKERKVNKVERKPFTEEEIEFLFEHSDNKVSQIALVLIYTGLRIDKELFELKKENVDLENYYIEIVESKTENGKRLVPIPMKIYQIIFNWYYDDCDSEYLVHKDFGERMNYLRFITEQWHPYLKLHNIDHTPHDTRHTYNSLLANLQINTDIRERLMGHSSGRVNEKIYTHYEKQTLLDIVNKL